MTRRVMKHLFVVKEYKTYLYTNILRGEVFYDHTGNVMHSHEINLR